MFAEVVLSNASPKLDKIFHYSIPQELESLLVVGSQIEIPFGKANRIGYVVGFVEKSSVPGIKPISKIVSDTPAFTKNGLELAKWLSDYYLSFFSTSLRAILPPGVNKRNVRTRTKKQKIESKNPAQQILPTNTIIDHTLTPSQQLAIDSLSESINNPEGEVFLLYGPAGSGKSEIYLKVVEEALNKGHGAIILTPEIGLTQSLIKRFKERFGEKIAVMHSGQKDAERTLEWEEIAQGKKQIVLGTRLAIFAPVKNLKVIILDEEYETTYKQEQNPRYQTRTVAEFMSKNFGITAIFGSATPSIESFYKAQSGRYKLIELKDRINKTPLPQIEIVDMKKEPKSLLSPRLRQAIKETLEKQEKVILFINRTGFFTYAYCRDCGKTITCPKCSTSMTYHFKEHTLRCGHCGTESSTNLVCPNCQKSSIAFMGLGTQRIEEEVGELFPKAKIVRIDRDSVSKKGSHEILFAAFTDDGADILIGTQMVTKGIDLTKVTLVGVVSADSMINVPDFRASEHAFQQLMQVAGRSGRHNLPGKVFIQTFSPEHAAIKYTANYDYEGFYKEEIENRKNLCYPPFSELINIIIHGKDQMKTYKIASDLKTFLVRDLESGNPGSGILGSGNLGSKVMGPIKATMEKLRGDFRFQILLKGQDMGIIRNSLRKCLNKMVIPIDIKVFVDIEPVNLL